MHLLTSRKHLDGWRMHVNRVRIDGVGGLTPQFPCSFHCDPNPLVPSVLLTLSTEFEIRIVKNVLGGSATQQELRGCGVRGHNGMNRELGVEPTILRANSNPASQFIFHNSNPAC